MHKTRSSRTPARLVAAVAAITLLISTFSVGNASLAYAQEASSPAASEPGIQALAPDGSSLYYYANGKRIQLMPSLDWVSVEFAGSSADQRTAAILAAGTAVSPSAQTWHISDPELDLLPLEKGLTLESLLQSVNSMRSKPSDFAQANPVFGTKDALMAITDQFIATFPAGESRAKIDAVNSSHGVRILSPILGQRNTFVLQVSADKGVDALSMANLYQESGVATNAAPNFVRITDAPMAATEPKTLSAASAPTPNDPLYSDQWYLNNTQQYGNWMTSDADIDAPGAWNVTTGSASIIIAVIDDGVELTQEDLSGKLVGGYDATGHGSTDGGTLGAPCTAPCGKYDDARGTNVAGIVAATANNSTGVTGVCQGCKIMPVRVRYEDATGKFVTSDSWSANGIAWAYQNGAAILDNSWGGGTSSTVIDNAIANAKTNGRSGKGSVVLFAAGDGSTGVRYPASSDEVIAVGASNMCDAPKTASYDNCNGYETGWGTNTGDSLDIVAPGVWLDSTDRMGAAGSSPRLDGGLLGNNYYAYMNGTAGATAIASGVAGLVLSANSSLTADAVQNILQDNADDVNVASAPGWDSSMGFGRVNADRAVHAAADLLTNVLHIDKTGTGNGSVTSSPAGIDCGGTCSFGFNRGIVVTLTATANTRSVFTGWNGEGCSGTGTCVVTMSGGITRTVKANFALPLPGKPVLTSPAGAARINDNTPTLTWNTVNFGDTYRVQIAKSGAFTSPVQDVTGASGVVNYTASTLPDGTYFWRVRSYSTILLAGPWSGVRSFTVDTIPPIAPVLAAPADNAVFHATPTFSWKLVATANAYQFEYDDDPLFGSPNYVSSVLAVTSHKPPAIPRGTYHWRVAARDAAGNWGPWSTSRTINIHAPIPAKVVLVSPPTGSQTTDTTPTLTWGAAANGNTYEIQIDNVSTFASPNYSYLAIPTTTFDVGPLALGKWFWRVRAVNLDGEPGPWSYSRYFTLR